ncbi:heterokaryon incompatibility protein [Phlyctema vagabunda]|uniref:Heterokaryon incompatibility protein n=1 Tax=Phlyctema vagabunda TaxID=108571 RepID=A0ABR4PAH3_9HELO
MSIAYSSLEPGHIRLLSFLDDTGHRCTLDSYSLTKAPKYIALSYTWGSAAYQKGRLFTQEYEATIDSTVLSLQQNLHDALHHLGHRVLERGCRIWIDFLCINQSDPTERSSQVQLMKEIYERATIIYAWLGLPFDDDEARLATMYMRKFSMFLRDGLVAHNDDIGEVAKTISSSTYGWPSEVDSDPWKAWEGITDMFNQAYWQRTWIYQEATTPGEIWFWCGNHSFTDVHLSAAVYFGHRFSSIAGFPERFIKATDTGSNAFALAMARSNREAKTERHLLELLWELKNCLCTDPRDKVFAGLGHATDVRESGIVVDYTKKLADVYIDVVRFALGRKDIGFSVFEAIVSPASDSKNQILSASLSPLLPSWVPDWRQRVKLGSLQGGKSIRENGRPLFNPCPGTSPEYHINGNIISILGYALDNIIKVTEIWDNTSTCMRIPQSWEDELRFINSDDQNFLQAYRRTLVSDTLFSSVLQNELRFFKARGNMLDWKVINAREEDLDVDAHHRQDDMLSQLVTTCYGRRMGIISNGNIGIFPPATASGDKLAAFNGGNMLYVIRPVNDNNTFRFIGECYVDGMMDGEALRLITQKDIAAKMLHML